MPQLALWIANACAFWLAEIVATPTPAQGEPAAVLLAALAGYVAVAAGAGGVWAALAGRARSAPNRGRADGSSAGPRGLQVWLPFAPWLVLQLPRLWYAAASDPRGAAVAAMLAAAGIGVLAAAWRRLPAGAERPSLGAYACGALGAWTLVLGVIHVSSAVPLEGPRVVQDLRAQQGAGVLLVVAGAVAAGTATRLRTVAIAAIVAGRLALPVVLTPPSHGAPRVDPGSGAPIPVVLVVMDTARVDHLSVYGYPRDTTPVLSAFAREALVFDDAVATASWTLPSHASLFTGLFPLRHGADRPYWLVPDARPGALRPGLPLEASALTLAEWLVAAGYDTGAVASNFGYLDPAFGLDQGFAFYDAAPNTPVMPRLLALIDRHLWALPWAARYWRSYRSAEQINRAALAWLDGRRSDAVFLFLNYMEPHREWTAPGLHHAAFASEPAAPPTPLRPGPVAADMRRLIDLYDSQVAALDQALGELFTALRRRGLYDGALVIVTSDHGESFGEHDVVGHGQSLYASEIAIPLLVKLPGATQTGRRAGRVQLVDVFPTVAATLGRPVPSGLDGDPLDAVDHPILAELFTDPRVAADRPRGYQAAVYTGDRKVLVRDAQPTAVFDVAADAAEAHDLAASTRPEVLAGPLAWVAERRRTLEPALVARSTAARPLDQGVAQALEALGYLEQPTR